MHKLVFKGRESIKAQAWFESLCAALKPDTQYEVRVQRKSRKRSLNANAYAWTLIDKISERTRLPPEYVYWTACREIGGNSVIVETDADAARAMVKAWNSRGLGWQAVKLDEKGGKIHYRLIYGSSVYDTKQMSDLISHLEQDAKEFGVETLSDRDLKEMLKAWS